MLRSKTCPIAAGRRSFYSVVVFYYHGNTMGCFRRLRWLKAISSASTVGCFRCYINLFRRLKAIQWLLVRAPFDNQFPVWMVMLVIVCHCLWLVMIDGFQHSSILSHYQQMFDFVRAIYFALEIGTNEDIQVLKSREATPVSMIVLVS